MFKFFKNYKTKRELREEIARLEGQLSVPVQYVTVERDVLQVCATVRIPPKDCVPIEI